MLAKIQRSWKSQETQLDALATKHFQRRLFPLRPQKNESRKLLIKLRKKRHSQTSSMKTVKSFLLRKILTIL
jgi:hypothetical protein